MKEYMLAQNKAHLDTVKKRVDAAKATHTDEDRAKAIIEAYQANDRVKKAAIAAAREYQVYLNIMSQSVALENFEYTPLSRGEWPQFVNYYDKKVNVSVLNQSGGDFMDYLSDPSSTQDYTPYRISTDWIYTTSMNVISSRLPHSERVNAIIADAMRRKIDTYARTAEDAGFGSLTAGTEYVLNDSRKTNMPSSNDISATSEGAITIGLMKTVLQHFTNIGKRVRKIEFNPNHASELWDWSTVVSGQSSTDIEESKNVVPTFLQDQIYKTGTITNLFGYSIEMRPVDTIVENYIRVYTDEPVGYFWDVPEMATIDYFDEAQVSMLKGKENQEAYRESRYILFAQAAPQKLNYARFQFAS